MIWLAALMVLPPAAPMGRALAAPTTAELTCGTGQFRIESRSWAGPEAPLAPNSQALTVRHGKASRPVALEQGGIVERDGYPVREGYVISWACVRATTGTPYLSLGYACTADLGEPRDCGGRKEWFRWLDQRGTRLDAGVPDDGPQRDRLHRRLGLAKATEAGIAMTPVLPE